MTTAARRVSETGVTVALAAMLDPGSTLDPIQVRHSLYDLWACLVLILENQQCQIVDVLYQVLMHVLHTKP